LVGTPIILIGSATIPVVRDFAVIPVLVWFIAGVLGIIVSERWWAGQQVIAARLASENLGLRPPMPQLPAVLLRHGPQYIDAWFATQGIANPVTGLVPPARRPQRPPFLDTLKVPARVGMILMFVGLGLLIPWGGLLIYWTIAGNGSPFVAVALLITAFSTIAVGFVVTVVVARARVRRRLAWAEANGTLA
jgi:hypothetical protein